MIFTMIKFRSMRSTADTRESWARADDPRITRVGAFLRDHRLDELPQLFNVLRGDMNIVGPRPEQPALFTELRAQIPSYTLRQSVLPGITGWAQIRQATDVSIDDARRKLTLDLEYLERRCAREDLRIMARTLPVVLRHKPQERQQGLRQAASGTIT